MVNFELFV